MQSSPPRSEGKARAIRELSRSLNGHSTRSIPSLSPPPSDSNPTQQLNTNNSTLSWNDPDLLMSTQHQIEEETNTLPQRPQIRSTAKKIGSWQLPRSEQPLPDTSMVNKQFGDFDHDLSDHEDISIEQARGGDHSSRSTPGKVNSSFGAFNSLYDITPPSARSRKLHAAETGSLRRDAQIRRASRNETATASPRPISARNSLSQPLKNERKRTSLAQSHAKISEDESSMLEERPPTMTFQARSTRWGGPRSRQTSLQIDGIVDAATRGNDTARSRPATAQTGTAQSFMLPDLPNLTELVSGVFQDGTPVFSKTTPARSRGSVPAGNGRPFRRQPNYIPIDSVPIPDEEKAIFASLQLLRERVAQLEHERAEAEKRIEEQEIEIIELKALDQAQEKYRRPDSGLGSTDGEGSAKGSWKVEKTRLEASVQTLQKKLERVERKLSVGEIEKNRVQKERDNMATQLGVAFQNFDEVKREKGALSTENDALRQEIDNLRAENDALREQLEREQEQYREETVQLRHQVNKTEKMTQRENETLRVELKRVRTQQDENAQQLARKEAELRRARKEQAEYVKLKADNQVLNDQLAELKAKREEDLHRWSDRELDLKGKVERRDETIRHFQDTTQEQTNEAMRLDNENLRRELAILSARHEDDARSWSQREDQLKRKIEVAREKEGLTREVLSVRQANDQYGDHHGLSDGKENGFAQPMPTFAERKPSLRREDTRTRIASRVQQEVRNSRFSTASHISPAEQSPRKPYTKLFSASGRASVPAEFSRTVSAPITTKKRDMDDEVESTTDLSLAPRGGNPYLMRGGATQVTRPPSTGGLPAPLDLTELSYIDADQIAQLRQALENERANTRAGATSAPLEQQTYQDTVCSVASKSNRQESLPRKSSMKDITERTTGTVFEDLTRPVMRNDKAPDHDQTEQSGVDISMLSNTSRRRRSAPLDNMTSAFIVPDIQFKSEKESTVKSGLAEKVESLSHDNDNCTVCRRDVAKPSVKPLQVPRLIPVSSRMPDDVDATLRPSRSPKEALALVVKELLDERAHLHLDLAAHRALLESHDVSLGMKKRTAINDAIKQLLHQIEVKDTQIYHLYDVLEGQADHEITEQDVEDITREVRLEEHQQQTSSAKKSKDKKVTIRSFHSSEDEGAQLSADEEELPWEGFEDTVSQSVQFGRRGSVY